MKKIELINLTPHQVTVFLPDGTKVEIPPSGTVARVETIKEKTGEINGIPVYNTKFGAVEGLPDPEPYKAYIVAGLVQQATPWRKDLLSPDTSPDGVVRDAEGRIVGVRGLTRLNNRFI